MLRVKVTNIDWCVEEEDVYDLVNIDNVGELKESYEIGEDDNFDEDKYDTELNNTIKNIKAGLPTKTELVLEDYYFDEFDDDNSYELEEIISEALSDKYDWLVNSFSYRLIA